MAWLADVGFGGDGLLEPIPMRPGQPVRQGAGAWEHALAEQGQGAWVLRSLRPRGWLELYTFTQRPVVQKIGDNLRRSLIGGELTLISPGWASQTRTVASSATAPTSW